MTEAIRVGVECDWRNAGIVMISYRGGGGGGGSSELSISVASLSWVGPLKFIRGIAARANAGEIRNLRRLHVGKVAKWRKCFILRRVQRSGGSQSRRERVRDRWFGQKRKGNKWFVKVRNGVRVS